MKPARIAKRIRYPTQWTELPAGLQMKSIIEQALEDVSRQMFGYHMVKLGALSSDIELPLSPIKHIVNMASPQQENTDVVAQTYNLPLLENSVDSIILAHELDFAQDPHQILREVDRVLIPNGHVAIVGFNPFSLCGLLKFLPINQKQILHDARFFSSMRIKDWLHLLGFEVIEFHHKVYSELFFDRTIQHDSRWQIWCEKFLPWFSATYIIVAKKRVLPLSLVKPKWKPKPNFSAVGAGMQSKEINLIKKSLL